VALLERRAEGAAVPSLLRSTAAAPTPASLRRAERDLLEAETAARVAAEAPIADIASLRASIPDGTLVLSFFAGLDDTFVFAADRASIRAVTSPGASAAAARLASDLRYTLGKYAFGPDYVSRHADRLARETQEALDALARIALAPLDDAIGAARRVVVVPHGPWHRVPIAALPFRGRPLVEHATVSLTPALGVLRSDFAPADGAPIVFSAPDADAPTIDAETRAVGALLPGARVLSGHQASYASLVAARAPSCVHIAAHGRFRPDAPWLGGVRLADGWVSALDFARLRLPGALVVLSGCETGVTTSRPGDEVEGLVRGVFASGAADLVASLWRVGDEATAAFMTQFHAARATGVSAADALTTAQRNAIAAGCSPWAWAGFALWTRRRAGRV
jgi:hypothetical protein